MLCNTCSSPLPPPAATGRPRRYCSRACRLRAYQRRTWRAGIQEPTPGDPCSVCGQPLAGRFELDHIIPGIKAGSGDPSNLQWVHPDCNKSKGSRVLVPHREWRCPSCGHERATDLDVMAISHACPALTGEPAALEQTDLIISRR